MKTSFHLVALGISASLLSGCFSGNHKPDIQVERPDLTQVVTSQAVLIASVTDKDNNLTEIRWQQVSGPTSAILHVEGKQDQSIEVDLPNIPGTYTFKITAEDKFKSKREATFTVKAQSVEEIIFPKLDELLKLNFESANAKTINMSALIDFNIPNVIWRGALGETHHGTGIPMTSDQQFRIASISKTLSAAVVFKLIEQGRLSLDTTLAELITNEDMPSGFVVDDFYDDGQQKYGGKLTVRQLLDQTSGLDDFISYLSDPDSPDSRAILEVLSGEDMNVPDIWHADLIIKEFLERGMTRNRIHKPGEAYNYTNTNIDLLAWAISKYLNKPFEQLLHEMVFTPLNMSMTYMDFHEAKVGEGPVDHYFYIPIESWIAPILSGNHNILELGVNTSFIWAGGGIISTLDDLNRFFKALKDQTFITEPALNQALQSHWIDVSDGTGDKSYYGLALEKEVFATYSVVGHYGFWGSSAVNVNPINIRIVSWIGQANTEVFFNFEQQAIKYIQDLGFNGKQPKQN
ncbi:serine hydrolase domain-containing protein [Pseudoalteromonas xiamenensis]